MLPTPRWLLLAYQLPSRPSHVRVKTWRRLQQIGAISSKNSVYVLPNTEQCREDFEWVRSEIVALGGDAAVFTADSVAPTGANEIISAFRTARTNDYAALQRELERLTPRSRRKGLPALSPVARRRLGRVSRAMSERAVEIERIDFFGAAG